MSKIVNGNEGPVEQPIEQDISPRTGLVTTRRWEFADLDDATALAAQLAGYGWSVKLRGGVRSTVEATTSGDGTTDVPFPSSTDSWELSMEEVQLDVLQADIQIVNDLVDDDLQKLHDYISGTEPYAAFTPPLSISAQAAEYLWLMHKSGFKAVEVFWPIFKINRTVDRGYNTIWEYKKVGKLLTTASVKTDSLAPADFLISLDQITSYYGTGPIRASTTPAGVALALTYAWKKYGPTVILSGYDKKVIQQQYKFGLWEVATNGGIPT